MKHLRLRTDSMCHAQVQGKAHTWGRISIDHYQGQMLPRLYPLRGRALVLASSADPLSVCGLESMTWTLADTP